MLRQYHHLPILPSVHYTDSRLCIRHCEVPQSFALRFLLHLRRGEELLLLILELHELVELDVNLLMVHERPVGRKVVGRHVHDDRGQRIARPTRGGHHARATAQESRNEKQQHGGTQRADDMSFADIHRYHLVVSEPSCSGSAFFSLTTRQPSST